MDSSLSSDKTLFGLSDQDINCSDEIQDENESLAASALTIFGISDQCCSTIDSRYDDLSNDMPGTDNVDHDMPSCVVRSSTPKKQTLQSNVSPNFTLSPIEIPPTGSPIRPSRYISTKRKLSMSRDPLHVLKAKCGCGNLCIQAMSISTILGCEQKLKHLKESEQKSFICEEIAKHSRLKKSHLQRMATFEFIVDGKLVCETAWCLAHNVSTWRFRQCKQMYTRGLTVAKHGNVGHGKVTEKTKVALSWMRSLFTSIGEYMPHKTEVHLPRIYTKKMLYQRMIKELRSYHREQSISYEHFTRIWSQHLPEFRISTKNSDFTVCSTCTELDEAFYRSASDDTKTRVSKLKEEHMSQVEMERNAYYDARMKSRKSPSELSCLIIDGMDQSKTDVPHLVISDKDTKPLARLPVHITGVIFHTDDPEDSFLEDCATGKRNAPRVLKKENFAWTRNDMCEQFRLCTDSEAFVEKAAGFLRATVATNGTSLTSNYSEELCLQYSYSEEDSEETYGQRELSPGEAQPYGKRMNEPLDQPSTSRKKFRAMTQPGSAVPILYNTSEDNVDTTSSATEQTKDEIRKAYLGTAKINIDNLSVGTALRDVNPQFVENLKKQMLEFTTHAYQPLCVIAKTLSDRGGFKEDTANGFHYDVIGGIHNLLATKALHEIDPGNEEFKCRLCIVYDDSLSKESHLWLANQHNLIGEYRHSLSFREKLMVCRNMFEQAQNSEQSWIDTSAFILSQEKRRSVKYFCSIASMNGDIFQRVTSVLAKYEKGKLKGQKVTSENLKEGPQMATYVFRDFVLLPQEAAHKLITDLDSGEINVTYFRDEAKTLRKLQTVQNMFLDLTLCKTWEEAMEQYPEACTRQCLQKYCEGSLKSIPVSLKNFCEKLVKSNAGEVMKVRGSDNTEGTFVISQLPSIDGGLISERCPCFPGFTLALLNKPKKWTSEEVRSFTTDVAALNINKGLTDFSVAVFTSARDTWDMCDILVATKHFKTVIATFYEISSSTKGPEVSECLYGIAVAIKGSRANQFTWHDGCNSNLIKCEEHERHKSTEAAKCVFRKLILSLSCPHDWVLDGCGSTGNGIVTSLQEGRNCLWIDEDPSKEEEAMIRVANEIQE